MENFKMIRGGRILNQLNGLLETTFSQLETNLQQLPTKKRQFSTDPIQVTQLKMVTAVPSKTLIVKALTTSEGKKYDTAIIFSGITYEDEETATNVTFTTGDDTEYNIEKIDLRNKHVNVSCTCLDFYHRFAPYNSKDGSLFGSPPKPYTPKTDRASDNPKQVPGVCKHLLKTIEGLRQAGMIK